MDNVEYSEGWITFSEILLWVAGVANIIFGAGAVTKAASLAQFTVLFTDISVWGWLSMLFGVVQIVAAFLLLARSNAGRILAIVVASISLVLWMTLLGALPVAGLTALALDVLVIYGLSVTAPYFKMGEVREAQPTAQAPSGGHPVGSH